MTAGIVGRSGPAYFLAKGVDFALYAVLDTIVDGYFPVVDRLSDVTDDLEDLVVQKPTGPSSSSCSAFAGACSWCVAR